MLASDLKAMDAGIGRRRPGMFVKKMALNDTLERLVEAVETEPYPERFTSSYWHEFGRMNLICREGHAVEIGAFGVGNVSPTGLGSRVFRAIERASFRHVTNGLPYYQETWAAMIGLARDLGFGLTFDIWKYAVVIGLLRGHWQVHRLQPRTFALIGDGHGALGALLRRLVPVARLYCIDLPKTLVFQAATHLRADPGASTQALLSESEHDSMSAAIVFVTPPYVEQVSCDIDCAINLSSMQEMNAHTIAWYFSFLRRRSTQTSRFYCLNRQEKAMSGGEVARFRDYPWHAEDEIFIDGVCPFQTHYLSRHTAADGPHLAGIRVPFVNHWEGRHLHRLVRLARLTDV